MKRVAATVILVLSSEACSSSYQPARSPRIAVTQEGGTPTLVRNGQTFSVGLFGGGLEDAVKGNPAAEDEASTYKTLTIAGYSFYVAGLASSIGGIYLLASENRSGSSGNDAPGAALALGGVAAVLTSFVLLVNAPPHLWDAVNIYNDGVDAALAYPMPPPPGFAGPAPVAPGALPVPPVPPPQRTPPMTPPSPPTAVPPSSAPPNQ